jgi:hypothetical protein
MMSPKRLEEMKTLLNEMLLPDGRFVHAVRPGDTARLAHALKDAIAEIEELQEFNDSLVAKVSEMAQPRLVRKP